MSRRKATKILALLGLLLCAYTWRWYSWSSGVVLETSDQPFGQFPSRIVVRSIPYTAPFWAVFMSFLPDPPAVRCELYHHGSRRLISAQTVDSPDSVVPHSAEVVWNESGGALIMVAGIWLEVDKWGYWKLVRRQ